MTNVICGINRPRRGATDECSRGLKPTATIAGWLRHPEHAVIPRRGATFECSRGFQPTEYGVRVTIRRGATVEGEAAELAATIQRELEGLGV